jgi:probable HAF family extracellular repeat protein
MKHRRFLIAPATLGLFLFTSAAGAQVGLAVLEGVEGIPYALSSGGAVMVGERWSPAQSPFRWENGSIETFGKLPGNFTDSGAAWGVSGDGGIVVGYSYRTAFVWENGNMLPLDSILQSDPQTIATDISSDGSVIVGERWADTGVEAVKWENFERTDLGTLPDTLSDRATAVSADGSVITGYSYTGASGDVAWLWENGAMLNIGKAALNSASTRPTDISGDGSIIVGYSEDSRERDYPFIWEGGNYTLLSESEGRALAITEDASLMVGYRGGEGPHEAVLWFRDTGYAPVLLDTFLDDNGVDRNGFTATEVTAVSADGSVIAGFSRSEQTQSDTVFIVRLKDAPAWGEFQIHTDGQSVDTGSFLGWVDISGDDWVYVYALGKYVYLPEVNMSPSGGWLWLGN